VWVGPSATAGVTPVQVGAPWEPWLYAPGGEAVIMGFGRTTPDGPASDRLLAADTVLRSDDYMDDIFNPVFGLDGWSSPLMIGAGSDTQTVCKGDSGGPLVVAGSNGHVVQLGVASFAHDAPWPYSGFCDTAGGFAELSGPQLAWVASQVPSVMDAWGPCTSSYGVPGHSPASYGAPVPGAQMDRWMYWRIWCEAPPPAVVVPDLRGYTTREASTALQAVGLRLGTVTPVVDASCNFLGVVMGQNPARGSTVPFGAAIGVSVGQRPKQACP
jgi:hypothetical protein